MAGQSDTGTNRLQIYTGSLEFSFKLFSFFGKVCEYYATIRRMDKILGKVSPSPYSPKLPVAYGELRVYFAVQIPPLIDWT